MASSRPERRADGDRRARPTAALSTYWLRGQRRGVRRLGDADGGYYVDHPGRPTLIAATVLLGLGILDGLFTLRLLEAGATEANPVMEFLLAHGAATFLSLKCAITLVALAILVIHKNFHIGHRRLRVKWVLLGFLGTYGSLISYELALLGIVAG